MENAIERALVVSRGGPIGEEHLPTFKIRRPARADARPAELDQPFGEARRTVIERFERAYLVDALRRAGGNVALAARLAGVDRSNLRRLLVRYRIDPAASG